MDNGNISTNPFVIRLNSLLRGRYRVTGELGRGATAVVFAARDERVDRPVAIKVLRPELRGTGVEQRFHREIEVTAQLQHPYIVPLFGAVIEREVICYAMPEMDARGLRARLHDAERMPSAAAVRTVRALALALDCAHRNGIIHRDVKPENVLYQDTVPFLCDFGVAVRMNGPRSAITGVGNAVGTPGYMAPEQANGSRRVDARADVYGLGCVLYEILTGDAPFSGRTTPEILTKQLTTPPPPLGERRPDVDPTIAAAVHRAMACDVEDRFPTAGSFADALATRSANLPGASPVAVLPFSSIGCPPSEETFGNGIAEGTIAALTHTPGITVVASSASFAFPFCDRRIADVAAELGVGHLVEGSVQRAGSRIRVSVQLVNASTGRSHWSRKLDYQDTDPFAIQDAVGRLVAQWVAEDLVGARDSDHEVPHATWTCQAG